MTIKTVTTCDYCLTDVELRGPTWVEATLEGAVRVRDQRHHHLCASCWDVALTAVRRHARRGETAPAPTDPRRVQQLPADQPRADTLEAATLSNLDDLNIRCRQCGVWYPLSEADTVSDAPRVDSSGTRRVRVTCLPCGHQDTHATLVINSRGTLSSVDV